MIHKRKRRVSDKRKILDIFPEKIKKALKCDPSGAMGLIMRKIQEITASERYNFSCSPEPVYNTYTFNIGRDTYTFSIGMKG